MMYRIIGSLVIGVSLWVAACTYTRKVQTGLQAYEVKQYAVAVQLFDTEYATSRNPADKARIAFLTGESYTQLQDPAAAASWYEKAHQDGFGPDALERYASSLKKQEKYQEAIRVYEDLQRLSPGNASYRSNITLCRQAMDWKRTPDESCKVSAAVMNSTASDYSPQPLGPGLLLFTSDREGRENSDRYLWTGRAYADLFVYNSRSQTVESFDSRINSPQNEGTAVLSPSGDFIIFTRCFSGQTYDAWCNLMISYRRGNQWSEPEVLPFTRDKVNYGHPALAANGTTLFFSSDMPEGEGGHDIYFSQKDVDGQWSEPVNLGPIINTMGEEQYPTVYNDTLFYSSDHLAGLGGLDIFKTWLDLEGRWVSPLNLRAPVNSGADDFGWVVDTFSPVPQGVVMQGYFTSSRGGISRYDDIYTFAFYGTPPDVTPSESPEVPVIAETPPVTYQLFLALNVVAPVYEIPTDPNSPKTGQRPLPNGPVLIDAGAGPERLVTDAEGRLLLKLDWDKKYHITARYRDHLASVDSIRTGDVVRQPDKPIITLNRTLVLDPIFKNKEIELENIFYDYDQWAIREDARPSLNALAAMLRSNPAVRIQLSSYTDCRGTEEYNLELSQKRAQAAIEYLISRGIASDRLVAQGFGESQLAITCVCEACTEEQHQANRRTTFKIID